MRVRYPRTPHLPWSPGATPDDLRMIDLAELAGREVVVTEKLDGENTTLYRTGLHARSLDSAHHPSRAWVKALHARIGPQIPDDVRICGENLAARHSIAYDGLLSYFYGFGVWQGERCLPWDETVAVLESLGVPVPCVLYRGPWDERRLRKLRVDTGVHEGFVVRTTEGFELGGFGRRCAKWVRARHVRTDEHWMLQEVVPNGLAAEAALWTIRSGGAVDVDAVWSVLGLEGDPAEPIDLGGSGSARLELVLASLVGPPSPEHLPILARRLPVRLAARVHHLGVLHRRLWLRVDDQTRPGGLVSLARSCDLRALHALAERGAEAEALEQVHWSRLVAEDAGLLEVDAVDRWAAALRALLPPALPEATWALVRGEALWAWARRTVASPEEAAARAHPMLGHVPRRLVVLVGVAGSGKSTSADTFGGRVVNLDRLRAGGVRDPEALSRGLAELDAALGAGDAVWDATSLVPSQRALPLSVGARHEALVTLVGVLARPEVAARRNRQRTRTVPDEVVRRQWGRLRWPAGHEAHALAWVDEDGGVHAHQ